MAGRTECAPPAADIDESAEDIAAQHSVQIHSCSRIGLVANPPGFSLAAWFRASFRR